MLAEGNRSPKSFRVPERRSDFGIVTMWVPISDGRARKERRRMARADSRRSRMRIKRMAKVHYRAAKVRQGATALKAHLQLAVFTANLFGSVALLMTALWLHL